MHNVSNVFVPQPKPRRRWLRYSLRTFFVLLTIACVVLGFYVNRAQRQRRAVAAILAAGGEVMYASDPLFDL